MSVVTAGGLMGVDSLVDLPHKSVLRSLTSFTPICHCGLKPGCFVQREVSLSL